MATTSTRIKLAVMNAHGAWERCGDFASREEAIDAAHGLHVRGQVHTMDDGGSLWGLSSDPDSGRYEEPFRVWTEGVVIPPSMKFAKRDKKD